MKLILFIFIIAVIITAAVAGFIYLGGFLTKEKEDLEEEFPQVQESVPQEPQQAAIAPAVQAAVKPFPTVVKPFPTIDTRITAGPQEGEIIQDNRVVFEFEAEAPENTKVFFETKIEGLDEGWIKTSSKKRIVTFPSGPKEYIFLVRAGTKDSVDPTPATRTFRTDNSPYFGKVKISSIRSETPNHPSLIKLSSRLKEGEKINITDWRLKGRQGEIIIPQAIERYRSSVSPRDVYIQRGDRIYLISGFSPLGRDASFRLNKCMGYLSNNRAFYPSFSRSCPKLRKEEVSHLAPFCQEFILRLSRCEIPDYSNNLKIATNSQCTSFIRDNFGYSDCFRKHSQDEDFLKNSWYLYARKNIVNSLHDTLYLYDKNGLLVDKYIY